MHSLSAIFIDTCVLEAEEFDFGSLQMVALLAAIKGKAMKLLVPHPTQLEIQRHVDAKIDAAVAALKSIRKEHALLREITGLPHSRMERAEVRAELLRKFQRSWSSFKKHFEVLELDYSTIDLSEVMGWYERQEAPFGSGGKRKEFPDAFAFVSMRNYAQEQKANIAVVSLDNDFRAACESLSQLHHYPTLASLTNALLQEEGRFASAVSLARSAIGLFTSRITEDFPNLGFYHEMDSDGKSRVRDIEVKNVNINPADIDIIGLGHDTFLVSFTATVEFEAWAKHVEANSWFSIGDGDVIYLRHCEGTVNDESEIHCVARVSADTDWQVAKAVSSLQIKEDFICVSAEAPEVDDRDLGDY